MRQKLRVLSVLLCVACLFSDCSRRLPSETAPVTVSTTVETSAETVVETVIETTEEITEEETTVTETELVFSTPAVTERVVDKNGQLHVEGTKILNENGEVVQLKGMSTYGLNGMYKFVNKDTVQTLAEDWGCSVIRMAMYTMGNSDGYIPNPEEYYQQMVDYVQLCIDQGVYVIIDWHILFDGDPNEHKEEAIDFFNRISALYGEYPNVIYEICNEPNGECFGNPEETVNWENSIRPYAEDVVATIRANDPDNIIIIGTATWSQDVDEASLNPLEGDNLMYTFHFYAGSHEQDHRDKVQTALDNGLPVFCTEWGTTYDSGSGFVDTEESKIWLDFMDENDISWCNWSIGGSVTESSNALKFASNILTPEQKIQGHWPDQFITKSGIFVRCMILGEEYVPEE